MKNVSVKQWLKAVSYLVLAVGCLFVSFAFGQTTGGTEGLGKVAGNLTSTLGNFAKLLTALSFLSGLGFAVTSVLQFKAYKDNAAQTPLSKPIVTMFVAVGLLFLPTLFTKAGETVFGGSPKKGSIQGISGLSGT